MLKDDEIQGVGNSYTTEFRQYDARLGRWTAVDPMANKFPWQSPYVAFDNDPILKIDVDGNYAVISHYRMTYKAMIKLGYSSSIADQVAHYASLYADNPNEFWRNVNYNLAINSREQNAMTYDEAEYGLYDLPYSQDEDNVLAVSIHAMRTIFEDIDQEEAVDLALNGGYRYDEKKGKNIHIKGANNILNDLKGKNPEEMTTTDLKLLGVALHTIQDAVVHKGKVWSESLDPEHNEHPDKKCAVGVGSEQAYDNTMKVLRQTIGIFKGNNTSGSSTNQGSSEGATGSPSSNEDSTPILGSEGNSGKIR